MSVCVTQLPPVKGAKGKRATASSSDKASNCGSAAHNYHKCRCYGHEANLPNYKLLTIPRTNNYYSATGGCPCIPRVAAHPGSYRLKEAQLRSTAYRSGNGCAHKSQEATTQRCCHHSGWQYGFRPGPHRVLDKNTAASGKCDTFGNFAFKSGAGATGGVPDDVSETSSASPQKLADLEALILEEHTYRMRVEEDVAELAAVQQDGTAEQLRAAHLEARRRAQLAAVSDAELQELLQNVKSIVDRPLKQTNMDLLRSLLARQEYLKRQREFMAAQV